MRDKKENYILDEVLKDKKENFWLECWENPSEEQIRLAKEFYKYWEKHGVLPQYVSWQELKRCYARANAHWCNGDEDENGNDIYELLDINSKI